MSFADPFPVILLGSAGLHAVLLCLTTPSQPPQVAVVPGVISVELIEQPAPIPEAPSVISPEPLQSQVPMTEAHADNVAVRGVEHEARLDSLRNPAPVYPVIALRNSWEGEVLIRVEVGAEGQPLQVLVSRSSGYRMLDDAAVQAVRGWRFIPGTTGGRPVTSWAEIPIRFQLEKP